MKLNVNIGIPGDKVKAYNPTGSSRDDIIKYISTLNLDEKTLKSLLKDINQCPEGALSSFITNLNGKIRNIRNK